jgi:hypothetical protein
MPASRCCDRYGLKGVAALALARDMGLSLQAPTAAKSGGRLSYLAELSHHGQSHTLGRGMFTG